MGAPILRGENRQVNARGEGSRPSNRAPLLKSKHTTERSNLLGAERGVWSEVELNYFAESSRTGEAPTTIAIADTKMGTVQSELRCDRWCENG
jgi:hypothetical protein